MCERVHMWTILLGDEAATVAFGFALGQRLQAGQAVALCGELGAGKTCCARGIAQGLGIDDPDAVASPTYLLVIEHPGPTPMVHIDAYLPQKTRAFLLDGGVDYLEELGGVVVVEWADRIADLLPADTLWVRLAHRAGGGRSAAVEGGFKFSWIGEL